MKQFRSESELFTSFRNELPEEVCKDIDRLLFMYDMYLDETDPEAEAVLIEGMNIIERKYNMEVTHGASKANINQTNQSEKLQESQTV
ncbi:hypothetical protein [Paenibacillus sp. Marseille-Q4541]|uniref:hypothetical protein n=1 Tax=Paenibacillus sp. Marseille-Q4541 TaxID=2831522 RepID=UPI001BA625E2|nr:hypothetical protein [Paenibacillus sp. Marseille-Q4541]